MQASNTIYPRDSIGITCTIKVNGTAITTTYAEGDIMSDLSSGKGKALLTVYSADGTVASDANGLLLSSVTMNRGASAGIAVYTISYGLATSGIYYAHVVYAVKDASGNPDWQKQEVITIHVTPLDHSATMPF